MHKETERISFYTLRGNNSCSKIFKVLKSTDGLKIIRSPRRIRSDRSNWEIENTITVKAPVLDINVEIRRPAPLFRPILDIIHKVLCEDGYENIQILFGSDYPGLGFIGLVELSWLDVFATVYVKPK